jgi:hypothetical protein
VGHVEVRDTIGERGTEPPDLPVARARGFAAPTQSAPARARPTRSGHLPSSSGVNMAAQTDSTARAPSEESAQSSFLPASNPDRAPGGGAESGAACAPRPNVDTSFLERFLPVLLRCLGAPHV